MLHVLRTLVRLAQTALSYILMLMVMNNFAGFFLSAIIGKIMFLLNNLSMHLSILICLALGIGYYLLNGVHPYAHSANYVHMSSTNSDLTHPIDIINEDDQTSPVSTSASPHHTMTLLTT